MAGIVRFNVEAAVDSAPPTIPTLNFYQHKNDRIGSQSIAFLGLIGFLFAWLIIAILQIHQTTTILCAFLLLTALPMVLANIIGNQTHLRISAGLDNAISPVNWQRCRVKFIGFLGTIVYLGILYWIIPEYSRSFYRSIWEPMFGLALAMIVLSVPYILWIDCRMKNPEDGYWYAGLLFLGRWRKIDINELRCHGLNWLVKGFFLPFMLAGSVELLKTLPTGKTDMLNFGNLYTTTVNLAYTLDVIFGAIGYLLTLRILDSHIQSVEYTLLGWLSAICCYAPFSTLIWSSILSYKAKGDWTNWLSPHPILFISWGFFIMVLHGIYVWATCSFGCRFSNLTNRGIIVTGPYRYLKHPAYISKNIAWWFMSVPFVAHHTWPDAIRACFCLLITNCIYGLRAWTEERHLLCDPAYQAYCAWINDHGLGAQLRNFWKYLCDKRSLISN